MSRILLQLDHKENRRLLAEWLKADHQVVLLAEEALDESFDLGILDGSALNRLWQRVQARKAREQSVFLPFLLVTPRRHIRVVRHRLWQCIDELITSPIEKAELKVRLETLLRARRFTLELKAVNAKLQESLHQLEEDEEAGWAIQFQLLPKDHKIYGGYEFSRQLLTSTYLSGDFVDYFVIDAHHLGFYMADVSGHGVSSAFVTVLLKSYMNRYLEMYRESGDAGILDPAEILTRLNRDILPSHLGKYLTMFYGVINTSDNCLYYGNGGQFPFPILVNDDRQVRYIGAKSLPVGLFDFAHYRTESLELPERFALVLISDGLLELLPQSHLQEKQDYLLSRLTGSELSIEALIQRFGLEQTGPRPDDITFLLIKGRV